MDNNTSAYQALGEAVVQAIVLNAGLAQAKDPSVDSVSVDLVFKLRPDTVGQCLLITHERVAEPPLQLRIAVPPLAHET
ncbi:MAG: hypothetical protein OXP11_16845 [Gammaproteobacteria bacterium]|nr:hypothetical protein [Gammaproteobacteria bacterium]